MAYQREDSTIAHARITTNLAAVCGTRLRSKAFLMLGVGMKLAINRGSGHWFYYPDGMIASEDQNFGPCWCEEPSVIFEVLSEFTRQIDEREKRSAYLNIPSVDAYVRIEQEQRLLVVERRLKLGWTREVLAESEAVLSLPTVGLEIPVVELYERLDF